MQQKPGILGILGWWKKVDHFYLKKALKGLYLSIPYTWTQIDIHQTTIFPKRYLKITHCSTLPSPQRKRKLGCHLNNSSVKPQQCGFSSQCLVDTVPIFHVYSLLSYLTFVWRELLVLCSHPCFLKPLLWDSKIFIRIGWSEFRRNLFSFGRFSGLCLGFLSQGGVCMCLVYVSVFARVYVACA